MNDDRSETKRDSAPDAQSVASRVARVPQAPLVAVSLSSFEPAVNAALEVAGRANVIERIWNRDASLWKQEEAHQKIIRNSLGWLTVAGEMLEGANELMEFASELSSTNEFQHAMVCGMGGSSLCPEVLRQTFGKREGFPELLVLDSTDPDVIANLKQQIDVTRCLFIIASKSGTTTEPIAFHRYWYNEVAQKTDSPGKSFVTITDPGSQMADTAKDENFRRIFLNQPDIGGRYSALSYFGMVPAGLMGLDLARLLQRTLAISERCKPNVPPAKNPAAILGAVMSECALAGRDKLTIVTDDSLSALGLWIEQLIAESTGKEGKGIVPVVGESLGEPASYGSDRVFVSISAGPLGEESKSKLEALGAAGHPVVYRSLTDRYDLGAEFFLWEMATAFAGWRLEINPFDQPNVQESKDATKALLEEYTREGKLQEQTVIAREGEIAVYAASETSASATSVTEALREHCNRINAGDYVALLAYVQETPEINTALAAIREQISSATGWAVTLGYGPRFLHSTGQLHKGGPDTGVFFQITAPDEADFPVPGAPYSFSVLKDAQALGDFQSLVAHGRRAIRVDLGADVIAGLGRLRELLESILSGEKAGASPPF